VLAVIRNDPSLHIVIALVDKSGFECTVPVMVLVAFEAPVDDAVIVPDEVPDDAEAVSLANNVLLTVPLVTSNTKLVAYVPLIVLAIS
jgi:hypothetical protein